MSRPVSAGLVVVAVLALAQGLLAALRALEWVEIGKDMLGRGIILIPVIGVLAYARGLFVAGVALLYTAFAWGAMVGRAWAWWVGLVAAVLNAVLVVTALIEGASFLHAVPWMIVPVVLVAYLLAPAQRAALRT